MNKERKHSTKDVNLKCLDNSNINTQSVRYISKQRRNQPSVQSLIDGIFEGNISMLSRAITLIESTNANHTEKARKIIKACLPKANNSFRIGITGVPGVGKSTFIEAFGNHITQLGNKVAVLAIDPTSSITKGSILGDKTRMDNLAINPNVYIRPSSSGNASGGVARKTRESILLCEAAKFNTVIVETVGVGQSEVAVHSMVDFFLLLKLAGAGDELQGIKRGIIEMADAIVINKSDGANIDATTLAKNQFTRALQFYSEKESNWTPKVLLCSALNNQGITEIWKLVEAYKKLTRKSNYFNENRKEQNKYWLMQTIEEDLKSNFFKSDLIKTQLKKQLDLIDKNKTTPFAAADYLLSL